MFSRNSIRERVPVVLECNGLGRTKQAHKDECDINKIVSRFEKTGVLSHVAAEEAAYGDFSPIDYRDALDMVIMAEKAFADLPARVRARFNNDPGSFLEAAEDPAMRDEFERLGLLNPRLGLLNPKAPEGVKTGEAGVDAVGGLASPQGAQ